MERLCLRCQCQAVSPYHVNEGPHALGRRVLDRARMLSKHRFEDDLARQRPAVDAAQEHRALANTSDDQTTHARLLTSNDQATIAPIE
jgi:hypothetical protein